MPTDNVVSEVTAGSIQVNAPVTIGHPVPPGWAPDPLPVGELLVRSASAHGERIALEFMGRTWSYAGLLRKATAAAQGFLELGIKPGTRVGLFLPNTPHYPVAYYGALLAGATVVNFSPLYSPEEVAFQAKDSGTEIMVCLDLARLWAPMQRLLDDGQLKHLVVGSLPEVLPAAKALGFRLLKRKERQKLGRDSRIVRWSDFLSGGSPVAVTVDPQAIALLQYTGGTTGTPKAARRDRSRRWTARRTGAGRAAAVPHLRQQLRPQPLDPVRRDHPPARPVRRG
jgi:long-chain acyl-CoA synthetase